MIKPKRLNPGDLISFVSPSSSLSYLFPERIKRAENFFNELGYPIKIGKTVNLNYSGKAGTIEERVQDIHDQFTNPEVKAIIATAGGLFANEIIPHLNYNLIKQNPKIFCGYSDNTLLSAAFLSQSDLISFYGPCVVTEFGEYPRPFEFTSKYFLNALNGNLKLLIPSKKGSDDFVDWNKKENVKRELLPQPGYVWLNSGKVKGPLIGGCLPSLRQLAGTKFDFNYAGAILFLDVPEGEFIGKGLSPNRIESLIADFELSGKLEQIRGLMISRLYRQSKDEESAILTMFQNKMKKYDIPVVYGLEMGHRDPQLTVPLGVMTEINSYKNRICLLESGVINYA